MSETETLLSMYLENYGLTALMENKEAWRCHKWWLLPCKNPIHTPIFSLVILPNSPHTEGDVGLQVHPYWGMTPVMSRVTGTGKGQDTWDPRCQVTLQAQGHREPRKILCHWQYGNHTFQRWPFEGSVSCHSLLPRVPPAPPSHSWMPHPIHWPFLASRCLVSCDHRSDSSDGDVILSPTAEEQSPWCSVYCITQTIMTQDAKRLYIVGVTVPDWTVCPAVSMHNDVTMMQPIRSILAWRPHL